MKARQNLSGPGRPLQNKTWKVSKKIQRENMSVLLQMIHPEWWIKRKS